MPYDQIATISFSDPGRCVWILFNRDLAIHNRLERSGQPVTVVYRLFGALEEHYRITYSSYTQCRSPLLLIGSGQRNIFIVLLTPKVFFLVGSFGYLTHAKKSSDGQARYYGL